MQSAMIIELPETPNKLLRSPCPVRRHYLPRTHKSNLHRKSFFAGPRTDSKVSPDSTRPHRKSVPPLRAPLPISSSPPPRAVTPVHFQREDPHLDQGKKNKKKKSRHSVNTGDLSQIKLQVIPESPRRRSVYVNADGKVDNEQRPNSVSPIGTPTRKKLALPHNTLSRIRMLRSASSDISEGSSKTDRSVKTDGKSHVDTNKKWECIRGLVKGAHRISDVMQELQLYGYPPSYSDDTLRVNLIRSTNMVVRKRKQDEEDSQLMHHLMISPDNRIKYAWSILQIFLLLYSVVVSPVQLAFFDTVPIGWSIVDNMVESLFFLDIFINIFSSYYDDEGNLVTSIRSVTHRYLLGWFTLDLLTCFPFSQVLAASSVGVSSTKYNYNSYASQRIALLSIFRMPELYRLLKMLRLIKIFRTEGRNSVTRVFERAVQMNTSKTVLQDA